MSTYNVTALVIKRKDIGEADKLLTLLTPDRGKIQALARGARKAGAKLAGLTEALNHAEFQLAKGKFRDIITQVIPKNSFFALRNDLIRMAYAMVWLELLDSSSEDENPSAELYKLAVLGLSAIENHADPLIASLWAQVQLFVELGHQPVTDICMECGKTFSSGLWVGFNAQVGGFICARCGVQARDTERIPTDTIGELALLISENHPPETLTQSGALWNICLSQNREILHKVLNSYKFLNSVVGTRISR